MKGTETSPFEVSDADIIGPASDTAAPEKPREVTAAPEQRDIKQAEKQSKRMAAKLQKIRKSMAANAQEAAALALPAEIESAEHKELTELARQARELAEEADKVAREGTLRALATLEQDDPDRLDGVVDFLARWPDQAKAIEGLELNEGELTLAALRLASEDPKSFVKVIARTDLGLTPDEKVALAEEMRSSTPDVFPEALRAMRLSTESVRDLVSEATPEVRQRAFESLGIPDTGGPLSERVQAKMELQEMRDVRIRAFDEVGRAMALEVMRAFPDRLQRERERKEVEDELQRSIVAAREFGKTATAPMVVSFEGRAMPALYKAEAREIESDKAFEKEYGRGVRPGIESGSSPSREWLAYQIDKALQLDVVPATVVRTGPEGRGSFQDWRVSASLKEKPWVKMTREDEQFRGEMAKIALLDLVAENSDRHCSNFVQTPDGKLVAIDNGLIAPKPLSGIDHVRSFPLWSLEGQEIPAPLVESVERLRGAPAVMEVLQKAFKAALGNDGERAWQAFAGRLEQVSGSKRFPTTDELKAEGNEWDKYDAAPRQFHAQRRD